ncbi:MAG: porin [Gammaproteobacteria bacterium]
MSTHFKRGISTCALGLSALVAQSAVAADKELLDILLANQKITKAQYDYLMEKEKISEVDKKELASSDVNVKLDKKGIQFATADENFQFRLGGRIHADASYTSGDHSAEFEEKANDGTEIRRARMEFLGTFYKNWNFKSQVDFADNNVGVKDMFINYDGLDFMEITVGQQKQAFSRELQESSNDLMFMERSLMNALNEPTVDRAIGLNLAHFGSNYTTQVGIYGDAITPDNSNMDEGWAINSRITYAPIQEKDKVIHLGIAGNYRVPDDAGDIMNDDVNSRGVHRPLRLSYETSHMSDLRLINTDRQIQNVDDIQMIGLEANVLYGPFTVGGEYTHMWVDRNGAKSLSFDGWYTEASWTLTGESRAYKKGKFYKVEPDRNFSFNNGGLGAWEFAARYAEANLNDDDITGGKMSNVTFALNWYINSNIRFMADYTRVIDISDSPVTMPGDAADELDTFMARAQLAF